MSERKTFTIRMQPELMKALKMLSVQRETTISDLIEEAVQDLLSRSGHGKKGIKK